jgi:hypothetical protein
MKGGMKSYKIRREEVKRESIMFLIFNKTKTQIN